VKYRNTERENKLYELFTATVSHEMKTPLNSIISLIGVVMHADLPDSVKKPLRIIQSSSEMLRYQVCDMLDLFAIKTDRFKKSIKATNVRLNIVQNLVDIF
jgi:two-component system, sensor histidine kinase and response regulator